jgi:alanyl-tRNA synthetase
VAEEIRAARPVTARRVPPEAYASLPVRTRGLPDGFAGAVRLVEIAGIDLNTCGGTHVRTTAEIEGLKLLGTEGMRGGTRLFYTAGERMRRLLGIHHARAATLRQLLGASDDELVQSVQARLDQLKATQRSAKALEEELATATGQALAAATEAVVTAHWATHDLPFLQRVAKECARLAPDRVIFLTAGEGEPGAFLLAAGEHARVDLAAAGRTVAELLGGRGGGSGRVFQGKATQLSRRDEALSHLRGLL